MNKFGRTANSKKTSIKKYKMNNHGSKVWDVNNKFNKLIEINNGLYKGLSLIVHNEHDNVIAEIKCESLDYKDVIAYIKMYPNKINKIQDILDYDALNIINKCINRNDDYNFNMIGGCVDILLMCNHKKNYMIKDIIYNLYKKAKYSIPLYILKYLFSFSEDIIYYDDKDPYIWESGSVDYLYSYTYFCNDLDISTIKYYINQGLDIYKVDNGKNIMYNLLSIIHCPIEILDLFINTITLNDIIEYKKVFGNDDDIQYVIDTFTDNFNDILADS